MNHSLGFDCILNGRNLLGAFLSKNVNLYDIEIEKTHELFEEGRSSRSSRCMIYLRGSGLNMLK